MDNFKDFVIKDDILERYYGTEEKVVIPENIFKIGNNAFLASSSVRTIKFPKSIKEIGASVFFGCKNLSDVVLPDGVEKIGREAFISCSNLINMEIPETVCEIGSGAFDFCSSLEHVSLPANVRIIGKQTFNGCSSLKTVELPENLCKIESWAFRGCGALEQIKLPDSVTEIGDNAFQGCGQLENLKLPEGIKSIGDNAFDGCSLKIEDEALKWDLEIFKFLEKSDICCIYAPTISLGNIPAGKLRKAAVKGYLRGKYEGTYFSESLDAEYLDYIKDNREVRDFLYGKILSENKKEREWHIRFLVENKIIPLDEFNQVMDAILQLGDPSLTAMVMNYKEISFSDEQVDSFEDSLFDL